MTLSHSEDLAVVELSRYRGYHSAPTFKSYHKHIVVFSLNKLESPSTYYSFDLLDTSACFAVGITFITIVALKL